LTITAAGVSYLLQSLLYYIMKYGSCLSSAARVLLPMSYYAFSHWRYDQIRAAYYGAILRLEVLKHAFEK